MLTRKRYTPMNIKPLLTIITAALLTSAACSDDNNTPGPGPIPTNNTNNNNNNKPDQDMDVINQDQPKDTDADPDQDMGEDMGHQQPGEGVCANVKDLGTLSISARTETVQGSTVVPDGESPLTSGVGTSCGGQLAAEQVFAFQVDAPARLTAKLTANDNTAWVLEARTGTCQDTQPLYCSNNVSAYIFVAEPGKTYYLVAEPQRQDKTGSFSLDLAIQPLVCLPVGGTVCAGQDVALCEQGGEQQTTYTCGAACSQDHCGGDICDNAIEVTQGTFRLSGQAKAYTNTFNFKDATTCVNPDTSILPEMGEPIPDPGSPGNVATPGEDVVFKLPNLKKDQKVTIDASTDAGDEADSAIFVMDSCDLSTCRVGLDIGDKLDAWVVPADGDYFVVVDRVRSSDKDIIVDVKIE